MIEAVFSEVDVNSEEAEPSRPCPRPALQTTINIVCQYSKPVSYNFNTGILAYWNLTDASEHTAMPVHARSGSTVLTKYYVLTTHDIISTDFHNASRKINVGIKLV